MKKVLVDTSVWVRHLKSPYEDLISLLKSRRVLTHSAVIGELVCGGILYRENVFNDLLSLPRAAEASFEETIEFVRNHKLASKGLGWIDIQLLASAAVSDAEILSLDKKLMKVATALSLVT